MNIRMPSLNVRLSVLPALVASGVALLVSVASVSANSVISWGRQVIPPPEQLSRLHTVSAGESFNLALQPGGKVIAWGSNNYRQATVPEDLTGAIALSAGSTHALALKRDGTVAAWGNNREGQATVPTDLQEVIAVSAGRDHSLALRADGSLAAWGSNRFNQINPPNDLNDVTAISAGHFHNLALRSDGTVVAWGLNSDGQASVPEELANVVAIAAGGFHSLALRSDGTIVAWGNNDFAQASTPEGLSGVKQIRAGEDHNLALLEDGSIVSWGRNHYGQTEAPSDLPRATAIAAGAHHNLILSDDGSFAAWGRNEAGQALNAGDLSNVIALSAWDNHTIALRRDGTVFWWGINLRGETAPDPRQLRNVVAVAAGRAHGLALRSNGTVVGWGDNLYGQATPPEDLRNVVAIAAGEFHSLALRSDGTLAAWGNNFQNQVNVPNGLDEIIAIAGGQDHSLALRQGGLVYGWGDNFYGQQRVPASLDNVAAFAAGSLHNVALRKNGTLAAWGSNLFNQSTVPAGISDAVAVAASRSHSLAIRENRKLIAWGSNHYGQSEIPPGLERVVDVAAGSSRTVVVTGDLEPARFVSRFQSLPVPAGEDVFVLPLTVGTPPLFYQWMKDGTPIAGATSPALSLSRVSALDSGSYSLVVANRAGNATSQAFSIEVEDPSVEVEANPAVAVLETSATFTAWARGTEPFTYQWFKDGEPIPGAEEMTLVLESVHQDHTGTYSVEVSNQYATTRSETFQFFVEPRIESQPPPVAVARIGERMTFEVAASGSQPLEIQWMREAVPIPGATEPTLVLEDIQVSDGGFYSAVVTNPAGRLTTEPTLLQIVPHILFQPDSQVFSSFGGTAVFEVRAIGTPPLTYQWMKDGQLLVRTPDPRLVLEQVQADDAGEYQVIVVNEAGRAESEPASLVVPPSISSHPQSQTVKAGNAVEFGVRASGTQPFQFQWLKNGEPIAGEEGPQLQLRNVGGDDSARYSVSITNEMGAAVSQEGTLSVSPTILTAPEGAVASPGETVTLTVEAEGTQPLFYQWTKDGTVLADENQASLTLSGVSQDDAGYYSVIVSNSAGIAVSAQIAVQVE